MNLSMAENAVWFSLNIIHKRIDLDQGFGLKQDSAETGAFRGSFAFRSSTKQGFDRPWAIELLDLS
jgi:hypothetical protein